MDFRGDFRVQWNGHEIAQKYGQQAREAVKETVQEAVGYAKEDAPVRSGRYKGGIHATPVERTAQGWTCRLTTTVPYDIWVEIGTARMQGHHTLQKAMQRAAPHLASRVRQDR